MASEIGALALAAAPASIYEVAAEVGDPMIEKMAAALWHQGPPAAGTPTEVEVDPWTHVCFCCGDDEADGPEDGRGVQSCSSAPLIVVVSPLISDDWLDPLSAEEVVFGVRTKPRRWGLRRPEPVWIC